MNDLSSQGTAKTMRVSPTKYDPAVMLRDEPVTKVRKLRGAGGKEGQILVLSVCYQKFAVMRSIAASFKELFDVYCCYFSNIKFSLVIPTPQPN